MPIVWISLFLLGVTKSGELILHRVFLNDPKGHPLLWNLYCSSLAGFLLLQILTLMRLPLFVVSSFFLCLGVFALGAGWRTKKALAHEDKASLIVLLTILSFVLFKIVSEPVTSWDALFHWFFQAKILFYDGTFLKASWLNPGIGFSHPSYPKGMQILTSHIATVVGYWNGYWPKWCLVAFLFWSGLGVMSFPASLRIKATLLVGLLSLSGWLLWAGYMDGYVGLFALNALMAQAFFLETGQKSSLIQCLLSLGVMASLKNEGTVIAALALIVLAGNLLFSSKKVLLLSVVKHPHQLSLLVFSFAPIGMWYFTKWVWGISTNWQDTYVLHPNLMENLSFARIVFRLVDENYLELFFTKLWAKTDLKYVGALFLLGLAIKVKKKISVPQVRWKTILQVNVAYFLVLFVYYLVVFFYSPVKQLDSSIARISIPLSCMCLGLVFSLFASPPKENGE